MRLILFFIGGFMLANLVVATSNTIRPQAQEQPRMFGGEAASQAPWAANERYIEAARKNARRSALDVLAMPQQVVCSDTGHGQFVNALGFYYEQRAAQQRSYAEAWGEEGSRHIERVWATAEDGRVERLTRESFDRGLFRLDDFAPEARGLIADTLGGARPSASTCMG